MSSPSPGDSKGGKTLHSAAKAVHRFPAVSIGHSDWANAQGHHSCPVPFCWAVFCLTRSLHPIQSRKSSPLRNFVLCSCPTTEDPYLRAMVEGEAGCLASAAVQGSPAAPLLYAYKLSTLCGFLDGLQYPTTWSSPLWRCAYAVLKIVFALKVPSRFRCTNDSSCLVQDNLPPVQLENPPE